MSDKLANLTMAILYQPWLSGDFPIAIGLSPLKKQGSGTDMDHKVFQVDETWPIYRAEKLKSRQERLAKYYPSHELDPGYFQHLCKTIIRRLITEHPAQFQCQHDSKQLTLRCHLSGETLLFNEDMQLLQVQTEQKVKPAYRDLWDALACQLQEDMAVVLIEENKQTLGGLHICMPNYWSVAGKLGSSFNAVHQAVPHFEQIASHNMSLNKALTKKGPYVRFAWGLTTDCRLNHHPEPPDAVSLSDWYGRTFDPKHPELYARVERQAIVPLVDFPAYLFAIRSYIYNVEELTPDSLQAMSDAINSMSEQTLNYKGLQNSKGDILFWLQQLREHKLSFSHS